MEPDLIPLNIVLTDSVGTSGRFLWTQ